MKSALAKQIAIVVIALIGLADAHWGTQLLGHLTAEVITILVTLALAALGFVETARPKAPQRPFVGDAQP